jgi:hypothetical protein
MNHFFIEIDVNILTYTILNKFFELKFIKNTIFFLHLL